MLSWKKASAVVGFAGLMPHEAAKVALMCKDFQNLPDPFGDVIMEVKVKLLLYYSTLPILTKFTTVVYRTCWTFVNLCVIPLAK